MSELDQILAVLREQGVRSPSADDLKVGFGWQTRLEAALGGKLQDRTDYKGGICFIFDLPLHDQESERWVAALRVRISMLGPYATCGFVAAYREKHWWTGGLRSYRSATSALEAEKLTRLRAWFAEAGLTEVPAQVQAAIVPTEIKLRRPSGKEATVYQALFA